MNLTFQYNMPNLYCYRTEYYLLFREKNPDIIQKRLRTIIMGLANCGLTANQTSNDDLRTILDNFLNGGMETNFGTVIG